MYSSSRFCQFANVGEYHTFILELRHGTPEDFMAYFCMTSEKLDYTLELVGQPANQSRNILQRCSYQFQRMEGQL